MRFDIAKSGSGLVYEIRNIVNVANRLKQSGVEVIWENIGDPVQKGEKAPLDAGDPHGTHQRGPQLGYSPDQGDGGERQFLAESGSTGAARCRSRRRISSSSTAWAMRSQGLQRIRVDARIIMPEPTYSTHLLAGVHHASFPRKPTG
jgi:hypothetical protein